MPQIAKFGLVFLELPGETILVSAAIFAGTAQELNIAVVLVSAVLGAILGSIIGFWIGDQFGYPLLLRYGSYIGLTETIRLLSICFGAVEWVSFYCPLCGCPAIDCRVHCRSKPDAVCQIPD